MKPEDIIRITKAAGLVLFEDSEGQCVGVTNDDIDNAWDNDKVLLEILAPFVALIESELKERG